MEDAQATNDSIGYRTSYNEKIERHKSRVNQFEGQYRLESKEGEELQDILFELLDISDEQLPAVARVERDNLLNLVYAKIPGIL
jgi:hypothetical protein